MSNNAVYRNVLDFMLEGVQIIGFDWKYIYVNDAAVKQNQYSREELIGFTNFEKYPGIQKTDVGKLLIKCMEERTPQYIENEFIFPNGSCGWFEVRIQPVPEGIFILSLDISDRKKAEQARKQYTNRMEEMIFITSHKVRQPVTQILGITNLLNCSDSSKKELTKMCGFIKQSALSLDEFTKELTLFMHDSQLMTRVKD